MNDNNLQLVKLVSRGEFVEEEVFISSSNSNLSCFATNVKYKLNIGETYPVKLKLMVFEDYNVEECSEFEDESLEKIDDGFGYNLKGNLRDGKLYCCGFVFEDEILEDEFGYLDGKMISLTVDRVDVSFK